MPYLTVSAPGLRLCAGPMTTAFIPPAACSTAAVGWQSRKDPEPIPAAASGLNATLATVGIEFVSVLPYCLNSPQQSNPCYPPVTTDGLMDFRLDINGAFYSPAFNCPQGWTTAFSVMATPTAGANPTPASGSGNEYRDWVTPTLFPMETAAVCCPDGFSVSANQQSRKFDCVRTLTNAGATPAARCSTGADRDTSTTTISFGPKQPTTIMAPSAVVTSADVWVIQTAKPIQMNWQSSDLGKAVAGTSGPSVSDSSDNGGGGGLGTGATVGIAVGVVFLAILIGIIAFLLFRRRRRRAAKDKAIAAALTPTPPDKKPNVAGRVTLLENAAKPGGGSVAIAEMDGRPKGELHKDIAELPSKKFSIYELPANETPEPGQMPAPSSTPSPPPPPPPPRGSSAKSAVKDRERATRSATPSSIKAAALAASSIPSSRPHSRGTAQSRSGTPPQARSGTPQSRTATPSKSAQQLRSERPSTAGSKSTPPLPGMGTTATATAVKPSTSKGPRRAASNEVLESPIVKMGGSDEVMFSEDLISPLTPQTTTGTTTNSVRPPNPGNLQERSWLA